MTDNTTHAKPFASSADTAAKSSTLEELADGVYAYTAEGDPNVGAIVGDKCALCIDSRSTPSAAGEWLDTLASVCDKPLAYLVLTHYHAVRVLGASAFSAADVICHRSTADWIRERGRQDFESESRRFPRLFSDIDSIPGLTHPGLAFADSLTVSLGNRDVELRFVGRGHTAGDTVAWLEDERVLFAGDLVEARAAPYAGDAFIADWMTSTLDAVEALEPGAMVPGRGPALRGTECQTAIAETRAYLQGLMSAARLSVGSSADSALAEAFARARAQLEPQFGDWWIFEHCLPFNVARALDEATGIETPRVWTAQRDAAVWNELQSQ